MISEPDREPIGIANEAHARKLHVTCAVPHLRRARKHGLGSPLDEERKERLRGGLFHAGQAPLRQPTVPAATRARAHRQSEPSSDVVELSCAHGPAEQPAGRRRGHPTPKRAPPRLSVVDNRDKLDVGLAERNDLVRRPPAGMTATLGRR